MTDLNTRTPPGDDATQRTAMKPAFSHDLLEQVLTRENPQAAWARVRASKGAAGIDGMGIDEFPVWAGAGHWQSVVRELEQGNYLPDPVRRVEFEKPDGGVRLLGIPTLKDRAIIAVTGKHHARPSGQRVGEARSQVRSLR